MYFQYVVPMWATEVYMKNVVYMLAFHGLMDSSISQQHSHSLNDYYGVESVTDTQ